MVRKEHRMNTTRIVTLVAATIITAAESLIFFWLLAPARVDAVTPAQTAPSEDSVPVVVVTARHHL
jgi:hypothetical protein